MLVSGFVTCDLYRCQPRCMLFLGGVLKKENAKVFRLALKLQSWSSHRARTYVYVSVSYIWPHAWDQERCSPLETTTSILTYYTYSYTIVMPFAKLISWSAYELSWSVHELPAPQSAVHACQTCPRTGQVMTDHMQAWSILACYWVSSRFSCLDTCMCTCGSGGTGRNHTLFGVSSKSKTAEWSLMRIMMSIDTYVSQCIVTHQIRAWSSSWAYALIVKGGGLSSLDKCLQTRHRHV